MSDLKKDEEKKAGGALPTWMAGSAHVGVGGQGTIAARLGMIAKLNALFSTKLASTLIVGAALAVSSYGLMDMHKRGGFGVEPVQKKAAGPMFRPSYDASTLSGLPGPESPGPSALDMAKKANKGLYGDNAAAPAEGATQDAAASARPNAGEGAPVAPPVDAAALAQQAMSKAQSSKMGNAGYGKLSSGKGPLAGGGGMAGGIGQSFQQSKLTNSALGQASAFSRSPQAKVTRTMVAANKGPLSLKGANARRLQSMQQAMAGSRRQNAEIGAATQTQQWANAQAPGQGIQGAGPSTAGLTPGKGQLTPASDDGGPINDASQPAGCAQGFKQVGSSCEPTNEGVGGKNVTSYQSQIDMAQMMLMAASGLLLISFLLGMYAKHLIATAAGPQAPVILATAAKIYTWAKYMAYAACACAAIVTIIGISILTQQGQTMQGGILTGVGAMLTVMSYFAAEGYAKAAAATTEATTLATNVAAADAAASACLGTPEALAANQAATAAATSAGAAGTTPATLTGLGAAAGGGGVGASHAVPPPQ